MSENQKRNNQPDNQTSQGSSQTKPRGIGGKKVGENANDDLGDMVLSSSPTNEEFISDAYDGSQELSKEDLEQIGVKRLTEKTENKKMTTTSASSKEAHSESNHSTSSKSTDTPTTGDVPEWERELQEELQEYDVVVNEDGDDDDDGSWEKEIEDMLEAEES